MKLRPSAHAGTAATEASVTVRIQLKGRAYTSGLRSLQSAWPGRDLSPPGPTCLLGQASRPEGWELSWPRRSRCSRPPLRLEAQALVLPAFDAADHLLHGAAEARQTQRRLVRTG